MRMNVSLHVSVSNTDFWLHYFMVYMCVLCSHVFGVSWDEWAADSAANSDVDCDTR